MPPPLPSPPPPLAPHHHQSSRTPTPDNKSSAARRGVEMTPLHPGSKNGTSPGSKNGTSPGSKNSGITEDDGADGADGAKRRRRRKKHPGDPEGDSPGAATARGAIRDRMAGPGEENGGDEESGSYGSEYYSGYSEDEDVPLTPEELAELKEKKRKERAAKILKWRLEFGAKLDGAFYNIVMLLATVYALFAQDFLYLALPKSADQAFGVITCICFGLFVIDLVLSCIGKPGYFGSLFFFLDLLATVSLLPDIPFIWDPFLESVGGDSDSASDGAQSASIARAGRAARAGTRAGRLVRIFKLFNLVKKKDKENEAKDELEEPSVVGKKLAELTTRKVIIGVMLMVAILPFLNAEIPDSSHVKQFLQIDLLAERDFFELTGGNVSASEGFIAGNLGTNVTLFAPGIATSKVLNDSLEWLIDERSDLLYLKLWGRVYYPRPWEVPEDELIKYETSDDVVNNITARQDSLRSIEINRVVHRKYFDIPQLSNPNRVDQSREEYGAEMYSEAVFDKKTQSITDAGFNVILTIFIVLLLAVGAALFSKDANKLMIAPIERMVKVVRKLADNPLAKLDDPDDADGEENGPQFETSLVEAALRKIGMLLQIGFGEAGAEIIGKNLGSGGSVNPMLPGARCRAVFGFCDIRNFTDATECLQEEVMVFVNLIASITHLAVKRHGGSPNKNIGDAFLVVYKTSASDEDPEALKIASTEEARARDMSNGALRAFLEIIDEIKENEQLIAYSNYPSIQARMPGYEVKMGFGLHYGWAIEGAIGSSLKIDASYLSPHVNLAARLESATKAYGVPLLISGELYSNLSPENKRICRKIDKVTVKGSVEPMELYTTDLDPPENDAKFPGLAKYTQLFEQGIEHYCDGSWSESAEVFQQCLTMWPSDEPARNLLYYMSRYNFRAPPDWHGYRKLDEK